VRRLWSRLRCLGRQSVKGIDGCYFGCGDGVAVVIGTAPQHDSPVLVYGRVSRIERDGSFWCRTEEGLVHLGPMHDGTWVKRKDSHSDPLDRITLSCR
jgi:hypothetical protein